MNGRTINYEGKQTNQQKVENTRTFLQIYECKQKNKVNRCLLRHKIKTHRQVVGGGLSSSSSTPKMHCSFERTCGENVNSSLCATIVGKVQKFNLIWFEIQFHGSKFISTGLVQSSMWTGPENGVKKNPKSFGVCLPSTAPVFRHVQSSQRIAISRKTNVYFNVQTELAQCSAGPRQSSIQSKPKFNLNQLWCQN